MTTPYALKRVRGHLFTYSYTYSTHLLNDYHKSLDAEGVLSEIQGKTTAASNSLIDSFLIHNRSQVLITIRKNYYDCKILYYYVLV